MSIKLNHMIVFARDKKGSAGFLTEIFGLPPAVPFGPFLAAQVDDVTLDFDEVEDVSPGHYAFLVSESQFDEIFGRIKKRNLRIGPIRFSRSPERSTATTAAAESISRIRAATSSRSSRGLTAREGDPVPAALPSFAPSPRGSRPRARLLRDAPRTSAQSRPNSRRQVSTKPR